MDTSPVGVAVFDVRTGALLSFNREMARIVDGLRDADQPRERLLELVTCRRADGREVSLAEWPLAEVLARGGDGARRRDSPQRPRRPERHRAAQTLRPSARGTARWSLSSSSCRI